MVKTAKATDIAKKGTTLVVSEGQLKTRGYAEIFNNISRISDTITELGMLTKPSLDMKHSLKKLVVVHLN